MKFNHVDHGITLPKMTRKTTLKGRKYFTPEGNAYPSITTVLSILSKDSIMRWRKRVYTLKRFFCFSIAPRRKKPNHKAY